MRGGIVSQFQVRDANVQLQMKPRQEHLSGFDAACGVTRWIMIMNGTWPDLKKKDNCLLRYYFLVPTCVISFLCFIPQTALAILVRHDFNKLLEILSTGQILIGMAILKLIGIRYNNQDLSRLVAEISKDWQQITTADDQRIMWRSAYISRFIAVAYSVTVASCIIFQMIRVIFVYHMDKHRMGSNASIPKPEYLEGHFFFDVQSSPMHEIIFVSQMFASIFISGCFASFDGFFVFVILHLTGQLQILQMHLGNMADVCRKQNCALRDVLKPIVNRHRRIIGLTNIVERNFNKMFLVQILATSILLCLEGYQFVMVIGENSGSALYTHIVFFTVITLASTSSLLLYCYIAEQLRVESEGLFSAAYNMNWYNLPPADSKLLLPFMVQTIKPMEITVGKFGVFSLQYFACILKTSAGYLSMLLAVKDRF